MRKFVIGLIVLGVLVALYMGYARIGGTGPSGLIAPEPLPVQVLDAANEPNGQGGKIGTTEVVTIEQTRFFHRDERGRVDREFGFEVFLHKQADHWRFTNPYMKLFLPKAQCHVTADTGEVQVQTAFGQFIPNDAVFQGNVVIHIIPPKRDDPRECFIHLDDVTFVAEKSLFSSTGPVRFVSRSAVLDGVGMELIYDSLQGRLELFRIINLKSLRIRSADVALFSGDRETARHERRGAPGQTAAAPPGGPGAESAGMAPVIYECILRRDATIDTPERIVIAKDVLAITDIPWVRSGEEPAGARAEVEPSEPNAAETPAAPVPEPLDTKASRHLAFDAMPAELFDIVVTCSGGLVIAPAGASSRYSDPNDPARSHEPQGGVSPSLDLQSDRQQAIARRIEYNATTGDATFVGPVQMAVPLDPNILAGSAQAQASPGLTGLPRLEPGRGRPMPMTVTAHDAVRYMSASNRVVFDGNCVASAERKDPNVTHEFTLSAPMFALDLVEDANIPAVEKAAGKAITLKQFSTTGGPASITVRRRAGGLLLGWTRVLAAQIEYEAASKLFTAHGPEGKLQLNNAQVTQQQTDPNAFGFNQPCYAFLSDFDELTFASDTNRIMVAAESRPILIDYIPVIDGKVGQHILGDAGRLDLTLRRTEAGRTEIASLVASGGVTYEDQTKQFIGSTLTYDREQSLVKVVGNETQPCYFNNALVDQIEMNVTTGALKTQLRAPSIFQGKR